MTKKIKKQIHKKTPHLCEDAELNSLCILFDF